MRSLLDVKEGESRQERKSARAGSGHAIRHNRGMAQGKRISQDIAQDALVAIRELGAAAKAARLAAGEGQAAAAVRLGVHVQTIARIETGEPGVAIGHVLGLLALYGVSVKPQPAAGQGG
jgi:hypothetical protein